MRQRLLVLAAAIVGGSIPFTPQVSAQAVRPIRLALGGGVTLLTGEDRDFFRDGFNVAGSVRVNVPALQVGLRAEVSYSGIGGRNRSTQTVPGGPDTLRLGDFSVLSGTLSANFHLSPPLSPIRPYILVGGGVFRTEADAIKYGQPVSGTSTDFGATGGVGADFRLGALRLFAEARIHNIFGEGGSARLYPLSLGVVF